MKRECAACAAVASVSLTVAMLCHLFFPGFGIVFKPLLWPLAVLPFRVRLHAAVTTAALVPLLSAAASGMPAWSVAWTLSAAAGAAVAVMRCAVLSVRGIRATAHS